MRTFLLSVFLLTFLTNSTGQTIDISQTEIKEVKIFFQGAEILRKFRSSVPSGKSELRVLNISSDIDPNSIIVTTNPSVKIVSLYEELDYEFKLKNNPKLNLLNDSIEDLKQKIKYKELQYEALEDEKKTLLQNSIRIGTNQGLSVNDMDQTSTYLRKKQEEINSLLIQKAAEQKGLHDKMQSLKSRQKKLYEKDSASVANVYLLIESPSQQNIEFTISYYVNSCGWAPTYNIYSKGAGNPLTLDYKANILNNSGEDWNKVKLSLLAGNPTRSLTLPSMETWVLSYNVRKRNGKVYGYNQSGNEGTLSKKQIKNGKADDLYTNKTEEIEVEEGDMLFAIEGVHTVPSSSQRQYLVDISNTNLDASYTYQTIPKIDSKAYLIAKIKDWEKLQLIEGNANVFLNETYVGRTYIDPLGSGDTLELSLGPDPAIQITRVKKKDFNTKRLIGLQLAESFTYEIDVRNLNKNSVVIEVFDQIPIAQQEEIHILLEEKSGASYQEGNGKLSWKLEIPAMQTAKLKMGYSVKYPRDKVVIIKRTGKVMCPKFR